MRASGFGPREGYRSPRHLITCLNPRRRKAVDSHTGAACSIKKLALRSRVILSCSTAYFYFIFSTFFFCRESCGSMLTSVPHQLQVVDQYIQQASTCHCVIPRVRLRGLNMTRLRQSSFVPALPVALLPDRRTGDTVNSPCSTSEPGQQR